MIDAIAELRGLLAEVDGLRPDMAFHNYVARMRKKGTGPLWEFDPTGREDLADVTVPELAARSALHRARPDAEVIQAIRNRKHPSKQRLADLLRYNTGLPYDIRNYIAMRMEGSVKVGRGGTTKKYDEDQLWRRHEMFRHGREVRRIHAVLKREGFHGDAYEEALGRVSKPLGVSPHTLDKYARPRKQPRK